MYTLLHLFQFIFRPDTNEYSIFSTDLYKDYGHDSHNDRLNYGTESAHDSRVYDINIHVLDISRSDLAFASRFPIVSSIKLPRYGRNFSRSRYKL